jgi:hypothetical protein
MQRFDLRDVPTEVLVAVTQKWKSALADGWNENLWQPCALCEFVMSHNSDSKECALWCPISLLNGKCYCNDTKEGTRLHMWYHDGDVAAWRKTVHEFINIIEGEINGRGLV